MSLLNDALRQKESEARALPSNSKRLPFKPAKASQRKKYYWISASVIGGVLVGTLLFWYFFTDSKPSAMGSNAPIAVSNADPISEVPIPINPISSAVTDKENHSLSAADKSSNTPISAKVNVKKTTLPKVVKTASKMISEEAMAVPIKKTLKPTDTKVQTYLTKKTINKKSPTNHKIRPKSDQQQQSVLKRPSLSPLYEKARLYHRHKRFQEAINMYSQILRIDSQHFDTRFNLISAYLQTKDFGKAHSMALDLYRQKQDSTEIMLNLAISCIGIGDAGKGLELLNKAQLRSDAPLYEIYFHQGIANRHLGQLDKAVACYRKAERIKPDDPRLLFNLAMAQDQKQHYQEAIEYYQKYIRTLKNEDALIRRRVEQRLQELRANLLNPPAGEEKPE